MSGIRSTVDIVMERTKNLTLSDEEKQKLRLDECRKKCISLVSRYLAQIIDATAVRSQLEQDRQECPEMESVFRQELIRAVDPFTEKQSLAAGLKDILNIDTAPYMEIISSFESGRERLLGEEKEKALAVLKQQGISGSALLPNVEGTPRWKDEQAKLTASLWEELSRL
jgi:hypothetical protein